jgi:hypothetical protein
MKYILAMGDMGSMPLKKTSTRKTAGEQEDTMYRACLTLDENTVDMIDELRRSKRTGRNSAMVRSIINAVLEGEITQSELRRFYSDIWVLVASRHDKKITARFNWPPALDDALQLRGKGRRRSRGLDQGRRAGGEVLGASLET